MPANAKRNGIIDLHSLSPVFAGACAACILVASPALAAMRDKLPPPSNDAGRCTCVPDIFPDVLPYFEFTHMCTALCTDTISLHGRCPECCRLEALDKFAETRAVFSQEASSGMDEAFVDVRGCDYSKMDLTSKVFSGVLMRGANFANSKFVGIVVMLHPI